MSCDDESGDADWKRSKEVKPSSSDAPNYEHWTEQTSETCMRARGYSKQATTSYPSESKDPFMSSASSLVKASILTLAAQKKQRYTGILMTTRIHCQGNWWECTLPAQRTHKCTNTSVAVRSHEQLNRSTGAVQATRQQRRWYITSPTEWNS